MTFAEHLKLVVHSSGRWSFYWGSFSFYNWQTTVDV